MAAEGHARTEHARPLRAAVLDRRPLEETTRREAVVIAGGLLTDGGPSPDRRTRLTELLWSAQFDADDPAVRVLERVASSDPNRWVRDHARLLLEAR